MFMIWKTLRSNTLSYRHGRKNLSTNSESALKTAFKILSNMYLYDGREKVPNYGKLPNGAQLGQCLLVPPYGN